MAAFQAFCDVLVPVWSEVRNVEQDSVWHLGDALTFEAFMAAMRAM